MTLVVRAQAVVARLRSFETTKNLAKEAEAFRTRADQLRRAAAKLKSLQELQAEMVECGVPAIPGSPSQKALAALSLKIGDEFLEDRKSIVHMPLERSLLTPLESLFAKFHDSLLDAWRRHVEEIIGPLPEGLLKPLEAIEDWAAEVRNIRALHAAGQQIATRLPEAISLRSALAEARRLTDLKSEEWKQLGGGQIPDEVLYFLSRAAAREARLADVTESVRMWLATKRLLTKFRVVPS